MAVTLAGFIAGCAGVNTAQSRDAKAALAPTGKLRVAFVSTSIYATKDLSTGDLKGVAVDLGNDLARRLEVPLEPLSYSNVTAMLAGARALEVAFAEGRGPDPATVNTVQPTGSANALGVASGDRSSAQVVVSGVALAAAVGWE